MDDRRTILYLADLSGLTVKELAKLLAGEMDILTDTDMDVEDMDEFDKYARQVRHNEDAMLFLEECQKSKCDPVKLAYDKEQEYIDYMRHERYVEYERPQPCAVPDVKPTILVIPNARSDPTAHTLTILSYPSI